MRRARLGGCALNDQNGPLYLLKKSTAISSHKGAPRCAGSCVERPLQGCRLQVDSLLRQVPAQAALNVTILAVSADKLNRFRPCLHGIFPLRARRLAIIVCRCMDTNAIIQQLRSQRARLDQAISALEGIGGMRRGSSTQLTAKRRGPRKMSAEARRRISEAAKARWAKIKAQKKH